MRRLAAILAVLLAQPGFAQPEPLKNENDCTYINAPFYMCDAQNDWAMLELPEDLQGIGFTYENGIEARIEIMVSPWVGIQVQAQRYRAASDEATQEKLTKIDGFPAITYIAQDGQGMIRATSILLLHQLSLRAETTQQAQSYTATHAARHTEMLAGLTHEWSFN